MFTVMNIGEYVKGNVLGIVHADDDRGQTAIRSPISEVYRFG